MHAYPSEGRTGFDKEVMLSSLHFKDFQLLMKHYIPIGREEVESKYS